MTCIVILVTNSVRNLQIQLITKRADNLKEQKTEEMLLNITVLDDLYIYGTGLADRRADMDVLKEFDEVSANLIYTNNSLEYEQQVPLKTPFLNIGNY